MPTRNKKETAFPESQVMTMFESINDGIEIIAESQKQLIQNQNELKDDLENFKVEIKSDLLDFKIETRNNFKKQDKKFEKINQTLKKHDQKFERVFNSLDEIKQEVKSIKAELDQMKKQSVIKREEFEILVKRVEAVEMSIER